MAAYATTDDLASRWRALSDAEDVVAGVLLSDAAVWLRTWFADLDSRVASGALDDQAPVMVSCSMVKRAMQNSAFEGRLSGSLTEAMGPISTTNQVTFKNPEGNLYLTAQEVDMLDGRPSGAFSMECAGL